MQFISFEIAYALKFDLYLVNDSHFYRISHLYFLRIVHVHHQ